MSDEPTSNPTDPVTAESVDKLVEFNESLWKKIENRLDHMEAVLSQLMLGYTELVATVEGLMERALTSMDNEAGRKFLNGITQQRMAYANVLSKVASGVDINPDDFDKTQYDPNAATDNPPA